MQHWIGDATLDRYVFRALKRIPHAGCRPITAEVQHLMYLDGLVGRGRRYPDETDVYCSLMRLVIRHKVEKYPDRKTGGIRYRQKVFPGTLSKERPRGGD